MKNPFFTNRRTPFPFLSLLIALFLSQPLLAQEKQEFSCGYDQSQEQLLQNNEAFRKKAEAFELNYQKQMENSQPSSLGGTIYTIPVVVHIIHNGAALETDANPTDALVQNIVNEAAQRFRHTHPGADSYAGPPYSNPNYGPDTEIDLCLATLDPNGNYTSGVTRHYDPTNAIGAYGDIAAALNTNYAWDKTKYCNLFVITDLTNAAGVYLGGYDFTIYDSGSFWSGLIAHEVGHYFSLKHVFYSNTCTNDNCLTDGDGVCDTPPVNASGSKGGNCSNPSDICTTDEDDTSMANPYRPVAMGGMGNQPDMLANYMDYTGGCWDAFTIGQKDRMRLNISNNRATLTNNAMVCNAQPSPMNDAGVTILAISQTDICTDNFTAQVTIKNYGSSNLTSATVTLKNLTDNSTQAINWTGNLSPDAIAIVSFATPFYIAVGSHVISASTSNPNGGSDGNNYNDEGFSNLKYAGGCNIYSNCATYNPNSANGPGNTTIVTISDNFLQAQTASVEICVTTNGDNSHSLEVFTVKDENNNTIGTTGNSSDCSGPYEVCFMVSATAYNNWIADGIVSFTFDPVSIYINPIYCSTNEACASIIVPSVSNNCPSTLVVTDNPVSGNYKADSTVETQGENIVTVEASFRAGTSIILYPGFSVNAGANFLATIEPCTDCVPLILSPVPNEIMDNGCFDKSNNKVWNFNWKICPNATQYHLYVNRNGSTVPIIDSSNITNPPYMLNDDDYIINANLQDWYVQVRALIGGQWTGWYGDLESNSSTAFSVEPLDTDCTPNFVQNSEGNNQMISQKIMTKIPIQSTSSELTVFPNPFREMTTIQYSLHKAANVQLAVYTAMGQEIKVFEINNRKEVGVYQYTFSDSEVVSGLYIVRLSIGEEVQFRKVVMTQ